MDNPFYSGTVAVIGLGYIGLPTAVVLASRGVRVIGVDVNSATVERVARGEIPFFEPDLATSLSGAVALGNFTTSMEVPVADAYIIAVPTPITPNEEADMSHVFAAAASVAPQLRPGAIVVLESTSPPGTTEELSRTLAAARPDLTFPNDVNDTPDIFIAHCPERVLPGRLMVEMVENNRVIGGLTPECAERAAELYRVFCRGEIQLSDATSAEMAKLAENSYRDVNIAYANQPGPGVGGHCIAVDPWFLVGAAPDEAVLIRTARMVNDGKPHHVVKQVLKSARRFRDPVIACLGLSYKANVDDTRESPAVEIVAALAAADPSTSIMVCDPMLSRLPAALDNVPNLTLMKTQEAVAAADIVVLLVDHNQFRTLPRKLLDGKVVLDTRGIWR